ncbi:hypothetical protein BD779DRAFT_1803816 [Infundibulicybe gibba]|nr:hypothetical protein BD779DRAFT_1803816 [Infundibulicybe gibba]
MGRWTYKDEDSYRLPEGFTRTGYDADTQVYTYRDQDGRFYEGAPGASYGLLTPLAMPSRASRHKRSQTVPLVSHDSHRFASPDTHWSNPTVSPSGNMSPYSFNGHMDILPEDEPESTDAVHWGTNKALPVPPILASPTTTSYETHYITSRTPPLSDSSSDRSSIRQFRQTVSKTVLPLNMRRILDVVLRTRSPTSSQETEQRPPAVTPVVESSALWL